MPPFTGEAATVPTAMPSTLTSMPNTAVPSTLDGVSSRRGEVPIRVNFAGSFSGTSTGIGSFAAASASAP